MAGLSEGGTLHTDSTAIVPALSRKQYSKASATVRQAFGESDSLVGKLRKPETKQGKVAQSTRLSWWGVGHIVDKECLDVSKEYVMISRRILEEEARRSAWAAD